MCQVFNVEFADVVTVADLIACLTDGSTVPWLACVLLLGLVPMLSLFWFARGSVSAIVGLLTGVSRAIR